MTATALQEILENDSIDAIRDAASQLNPAELVRLHEMEVEGQARENVADFLDEMIKSAASGETNELADLLEQHPKQVIAALADKSAEQLASLRALEESGKNRPSIIKAIDEIFAAASGAKPSPKQARGEVKLPKHCDPNYNGPLTGDQAQQRLAYFKSNDIDPDTGKKRVK